ncbi:MAG: PEP-CTERM sorting domain-containing protein [Syntrophales bacterium]|nr:PEP-CTERM sorting domain-containing protein [Syntrophales bacterium]
MKAKISACVVAIVMLMAFTTVSMADQVQFRSGGYVGGYLGVFDTAEPANYLFDTFCLEVHEILYPWSAYSYTIDTYAYGGGGGAVDNKDDLDPMTAYLYTHFRRGDLAGFTLADTNALQYAIRYIEQEVVAPAAGSKADDFYQLALASGWTDIGDVRVLNPYNAAGEWRQSVLTLVPEPMTLLLLGVGLLGLGITRKLKK